MLLFVIEMTIILAITILWVQNGQPLVSTAVAWDKWASVNFHPWHIIIDTSADIVAQDQTVDVLIKSYIPEG